MENVYIQRTKLRLQKYSKRQLFTIIGGIFGIVVLIVIAGTAINTMTKNQATLGVSDKPEGIAPKAMYDINKNFNFSLKDSTGKEVSKIKYFVGQASLQDQIIWQGERATAIQGRTFLIITLKITNDYDQGIKINSKDYVRLKIGNSNELYAPEINNDPVEVQAKSTKPTRIGFAIDDTNQPLTLIVGEIKGQKENIKLDLN